MSGRSPYDAVDAFLAPLQLAVSCLGHGKITCSPTKSPRVDQECQWTVNNAAGLDLRAPGRELTLHADMWWKVVRDEGDRGPLRVTTLGYAYSMTDGDRELWAMHWDPRGPSAEREPHLHLGPQMTAATPGLTDRHHLRTGRLTFEDAVRWAVEFGASPVRDDWEKQLALAEQPHLLHRSWGGSVPASA